MRTLLPLVAIALLPPASSASDPLRLGPEELVRTANGAILAVPGYSVPSLVDWNGDGLADLVVGEGGGGFLGKVRVYLNVGTPHRPRFDAFFYAQAAGFDLMVPGSGCLGAFPRVVDWDGDGRKDLLVGRADGRVQIHLNIATDAAPAFDGGTFVLAGPPGAKTVLSVGARATPELVDWDGDGDEDLVVGGLDGKLRLFVNDGTDAARDFRQTAFVQCASGDLVVSGGRASPVVCDLDRDGVLDILAGNTTGQVFCYLGPSFASEVHVQADGVPIQIPGYPRARPSLCRWTSDSAPDLLVGAGDGQVRLYQGESCELTLDAGPAPVAAPDKTLELTLGRGRAGDPVLLLLVGIDDVPLFLPWSQGAFAPGCEWRTSFTVPRVFAGREPTFRAYAITMCSGIAASNDVSVRFR